MSSTRPRRSRRRSVWARTASAADAEDGGLDVVEAIHVAADTGYRVVVEERFGQTDDRIGERGGFHGSLVGARATSSSIQPVTRATMYG